MYFEQSDFLFSEALCEALGIAEELPEDLWGAYPSDLNNLETSLVYVHKWSKVHPDKLEDLVQSKNPYISLGGLGIYKGKPN